LWSLILILIAAFLAGMALGGFYFWNVWRSVRKLAEEPQAHSLLLGYLFRLGVAMAGFFLIMGGQWERLSAALAGFLVARAILVRRWGNGNSGKL
jgi:F1F0 ATPase subunit 2